MISFRLLQIGSENKERRAYLAQRGINVLLVSIFFVFFHGFFIQFGDDNLNTDLFIIQIIDENVP